jgi:hypothetical protein
MATTESKAPETGASGETKVEEVKYLSTLKHQRDLNNPILTADVIISFPKDGADTKGTYKVSDIIHFHIFNQLLFEVGDNGVIRFLDDSIRETPLENTNKWAFDWIVNMCKTFYDNAKLEDNNKALDKLAKDTKMEGKDEQFITLFTNDFFIPFNDLLNATGDQVGRTKYIDFRTMRDTLYCLHNFTEEQEWQEYVNAHCEFCGLIEAFLANKIHGNPTDIMRQILCDPPSDYTEEDKEAINDGVNILDEKEMNDWRKEKADKASKESGTPAITDAPTPATASATVAAHETKEPEGEGEGEGEGEDDD